MKTINYKKHSLENNNNKEEDKCLKNWNEWLIKRKSTFTKLSRSLDRKPDELIMNACENVRNIHEDKLLLEYTKITTDFDRYRGNPDFWKLPVGLPDKLGRERDPIYFAVKTKEERNIVPDIDYIGLAGYIKKEKLLLPRTRLLNKLWQNMEYRHKKLISSATKIKEIQPHKPEMQELIIVGNKLDFDRNLLKKATKQDNTHLLLLDNCGTDTKPVKQPKLSLKVNNTHLNEFNQKAIELIFGNYEIERHQILKRYLIFENLGTCALRISFERVEKFKLFRDIIPDRPKHVGFYFNSNQFIVLPGESVKFPVWFKNGIPGLFKETWEIKTEPKISNSTLVLLATASYNKTVQNRVDEIKEMLDKKCEFWLIEEILDNLLDEAVTCLERPEVLLPVCQFDEQELFEAANSSFTVLNKHPKYLYDKNIVEELKLLYQEVKEGCDNYPNNWDYSIVILEKMTREKDIRNYKEFRENLIKSREIVVQEVAQKKINVKKEIKKLSKIQELNLTADILQTKNTENNVLINYKKLEKLLEQLQESEMVLKNNDRIKYFQVFSLLTAHFNKMCNLIEILETELNISIRKTYPHYKTTNNKFPDRLIYEYYNDSILIRNININTEIYNLEGQPKSEKIKNLTTDNLKLIHATYFDLPIIAEKNKKTDDKKSKDTKTNESKPDSNEYFNPYAEIFHLDDEIVEYSIDSKSHESLIGIADDNSTYEYHLYVIIYTCLQEAVDSIVEILESDNICTVSNEVVNLCQRTISAENELLCKCLSESSTVS